MTSEGLSGELYLRSTRPFLSDEVSNAEGDYLVQRLKEAGAVGPVLDVGCGHGRHLRRVAGERTYRAVGLDVDALSLRESCHSGPLVRGDFFRLPFRAEGFGAAYCWYNTLGTFDDAAVPRALTELARCLKPGGWFIVQGTSPETPKASPESTYEGRLADGTLLKERVRYERETGRDWLVRELTLPDGRFMAASFFIRYYALPEWEALFDAAGFEVRWAQGGVDGSRYSRASSDLIVGAQKRG